MQDPVVRSLLARARSAGFSVHLETTNVRNVSFYERAGFSTTGVAQLGTDGPMIRGMASG